MRLWVLQRGIHISWLIAILSLSFVSGVYVASLVRWPLFAEWWLPFLALLAGGLALWRQRVAFIPLLVVGGLILGMWRGSLLGQGLLGYQPLYGQQVMVSGFVRDDPVVNQSGLLNLEISRVAVGDLELAGVVRASVAKESDVKRGDEVVVLGKLDEGLGTFPASMFRAKIISVARSPTSDPGRVVRDWFGEGVRAAIPEPQASLGLGYLLGQKSALPSDLSEALQIAGLTHIVVASGYNLTILVRVSRRLFIRFSKYLATFASSLMIAGFVMITGLSPSMSRAGLVASLSLATWYYGRRFHPFVLLPLAAAITVAVEPSYAWGDLGWQLSFSAFAGVMIVAPLLQRFFFGDKKPGLLRQILGETVAAHIVTVPIVLLSFGVLSNVAIPANLLIVPLVPLAMLLTFLTGVLSLALPLAGSLIGAPTGWLLGYMTTVAEFAAGLPWAQTELKLEWWAALIYYAVLVAACWYMWWRTKYDLRETNLVD